MNIKKTTLILTLFVSFTLFAQNKVNETFGSKNYLDSIKNTFVKNQKTNRLDSLWINEMTNLDLYNNLSESIAADNLEENVNYELPTDVLKERLAAMDKKSPFHIDYNPALENNIKAYLKTRKRSFERLMAISKYYFPIFEEALAKYNVPLEIKYLAIVESALNPRAVSRVGATGLWQFMYQTGKEYNLKIDSYIDERRDPIKASEAAAQYLSKMYAIFGDWDLVLASYNSGATNVLKAIKRSNGQQNYWNIRKKLPKETSNYVPAFLATMYIFEYHKEHGIKPEKALLQNFATDTIHIKRQMSFKQISALLDMPVAQLQLLNPSYKLDEIPFYTTQVNCLKLPQDKISIFTSNEEKIYAYIDHEASFREKPFIAAKKAIPVFAEGDTIKKTKYKYYTVKRGDNLSEIADKYAVSTDDLKRWNHIKGKNINRGKRLKINYTETTIIAATTTPEKAIETNIVAETDKNLTYHIVQKDDDLENISKKYAVSTADLMAWNQLVDEKLATNSKLIVAKRQQNILISKENALVANKIDFAKPMVYSVKRGDTIYSILKQYPNISLTDFKKWNKITLKTKLKPGMKLKLNS